ncbi:hypothetical protein [Bradyrhizobium stylosanthis]|uniref:DUF2357 domain-containing protein n=1 Tax=Bradyrhizobium stylosanthis TaxID=1803665 RepID=A0A560DZC5_9BRAD|nr:hypothetical protein [Bradyrhizobium stylosanthis]TWB02452.1 hypothetical protein FBZ96_1031234 [Bradyrhizobium stylosanthis]
MAVGKTEIEAVRITGADNVGVEHPWRPDTWYIVRDDCAYLDILIRGGPAQAAKGRTGLTPLSDTAPEGTKWQRWDLEGDLSWRRRFGEVSLALKAPKNCTLRCYVVPVMLLSYRDVIAMVEDIEKELSVDVGWDMLNERPERSWSRRSDYGSSVSAAELIGLVDDELRAALSVRRDPFSELGPRSRHRLPLAENAIVSHWAMRRQGQLKDAGGVVRSALEAMRSKAGRNSPEQRQKRIEGDIGQLASLEHQLTDLRAMLAYLGDDAELATFVYPSPLFQRDHRLRKLLRAFAPRVSESLSEVESARSHYPPVYLNNLWELWGAIWLAKQLRLLGFQGVASTDVADIVRSCSWRMTRGDIVVELDYEPTPTFVDHERLPPAHERQLPALEWAADNQKLDPHRPFLSIDPHCAPDYVLRVTTRFGKSLIVGDACLASPKHHGKGTEKGDSKPHAVERYRRTLGWASEGQVIRCHPMGGFVLFPTRASDWAEFERMPGAGDITLLCPNPLDDADAGRRFAKLLAVVAPVFSAELADNFAAAGVAAGVSFAGVVDLQRT